VGRAQAGLIPWRGKEVTWREASPGESAKRSQAKALTRVEPRPAFLWGLLTSSMAVPVDFTLMAGVAVIVRSMIP